MAFSCQPMQPGMLYDAAVRVAAEASFPEGHDVIGEMGWPLVLLPEDKGGMGGTLTDLTALVEGLAAHASPLPVIERCAVAPLLLQAGGDTPWLEGLADGSQRIAPLLGSRSHNLGSQALTATASSDGYVLQGEIQGVDATGNPTHWLAVARSGQDLCIFVLDADQLPAPQSRYCGMDGRHTSNFRLEGVSLSQDRCIAKGEAAEKALVRAAQAALAMVCADSVAVLGTMVEHTVTYLNGRVQFGVALSTFQALRHQLVNVYMRYESGRGMITNYLDQAGQNEAVDARRLSLAKLALGESGRYSAETVIQLHGGMGMTEEMLAARLAQRLLANEFRYGDRFTHSAAVPLRRP